MASKGPAGKRESQGATTAKNKQDIIEVEILTNTFFCQALSQVEEDNFNFEAVASTTVYPVFCQPLLVALNTVNENTKFVKFSLNKTIQVRHLSTFQVRSVIENVIQGQANAADWELLRDSAKVFWRGEKPYAFATVRLGIPISLKTHFLGAGLSESTQRLQEQIREGGYLLELQS